MFSYLVELFFQLSNMQFPCLIRFLILTSNLKMEGQTFLLWAEASITCLSLSCPLTSMGTKHEKTERCGGG